MSQETEPLNVESVKEAMKNASDETPSSYLDSTNEALLERIGIEGRFLGLRREWSWCLLIWISGLLIFEAVITVGVGLGLLSYIDYKWFLTIVFGETFLQIIAMGYVVIKFLFPPGVLLDIS